MTVFLCSRDGTAHAATPSTWRCPDCGGPLDLPRAPLTPDARLDGDGLWRYAEWLPAGPPVRLGEPTTPLVRWGEGDVLLKLEGALPTGSFKDRGAAVLTAWLKAQGATRVIEDSSGNAGAALAAYCARAGIAVDMYVPAAAPPAKLTQITAAGASLVPVEGPRPEASRAAEEAAAAGAVYASHAWNPLYLAGTSTFAFELWEQLGRRAPDTVVFPVGGGSLLLGAFLGFSALRDAGLADRVPRLVAAQAAACAPLAGAMRSGSPEPVRVELGDTAADGIRIPAPVRGAQVLAALRATGGDALAVEEDALWDAYRGAARRGLLVERTAAVALAALDVVERAGTTVVAVTGNGLKTPPVTTAPARSDP